MTKPVKVLHILGSAQPAGSSIARIVAALARGLNPQKYEAHAWFLQSEGPLVAELCDAGAAARWVSWPRGVHDPQGALRFLRMVCSQDFAIVHQHWGARSIRHLIHAGSSAKLIVHLHEQVLEHRKREISIAVGGADAIIAVANCIACQLPGQRVHVVYSAVEPSENIDRRSAQGSTVVIGTACRLVEGKGLRELVSAFARLNREFPAIRLEIAGDGPVKETVAKAAVDQGVGGSVRFLGWRGDLRQVLAAWDIFALPSHNEALPIAVLEAMAEGLPVVATRVGGLPELVEDARTGYLIQPRDVDALHDALRRLVATPDLRNQMGEAGQLRTRTQFSVGRMVGKIESIYELLIGDQSEDRRGAEL